MGKQHITVTAIRVLIALAFTGSASGDPQISLLEAEAALEAARGAAVVRACRADAFIRVGTDRVESVAYFTLRCHESTDNWTANVNLATGLTTWMPCAMFRMLAPDVGPRCLDRLEEWE
jgi:hypothetical protein